MTPRVWKSVPEAHISSLAAGNILGVLTWGYKLKNGPLRCDLFDIETTLLNAYKVLHCVGSTGPDFGLEPAKTIGQDIEGEGAQWGQSGA